MKTCALFRSLMLAAVTGVLVVAPAPEARNRGAVVFASLVRAKNVNVNVNVRAVPVSGAGNLAVLGHVASVPAMVVPGLVGTV